MPECTSVLTLGATPGLAACRTARELPLATLNIKDYADFAEHEGLERVH